jgi:hypothetical protein
MVQPNSVSLFFFLFTSLFLAAISMRGLYSLVAHPIMTGFLLGAIPPSSASLPLRPSGSLVFDAGFWATPIMNGSRFLFAAFNSIYCVSAVKFLEGIFAVGLCKILRVVLPITACFLQSHACEKRTARRIPSTSLLQHLIASFANEECLANSPPPPARPKQFFPLPFARYLQSVPGFCPFWPTFSKNTESKAK